MCLREPAHVLRMRHIMYTVYVQRTVNVTLRGVSLTRVCLAFVSIALSIIITRFAPVALSMYTYRLIFIMSMVLYSDVFYICVSSDTLWLMLRVSLRTVHACDTYLRVYVLARMVFYF